MEKNDFSTVVLNGQFIEKYICKADATFVLILLYVKSTEISDVSLISQGLSLEEETTVKGLDYWVLEGVLERRGKEYFVIEKKKPLSFDQRPEYMQTELAMYAEKNPEVKELFNIAQKYLGRFLTHSDLACTFGLHHWLGLSIPVIDKLFSYCTENGHRNMRYIEKVAINWSEKNILTPKGADEKMRMHNVDFRRIMRALGQGGRDFIEKEEEYMEKWLNQYKLPLEVIEYACQKAVLYTGKASFAYVDRILVTWKEADVKTCEEADIISAKNAETRKKNGAEKKFQAEPKKNKFINFEQRTYDFDEYERMELQRISKKEQ